MARRERSAGMMIFFEKQAPASGRLFLLLNYGKHWDFAKGHLKKNESDEEAAYRELEEETGLTPLQISIVPRFSHEIEYFFQSPKKGLIHKSVVFFLAETRSKEIKLSDEHVGYDFLPFDEALARLTYKTAKEVLIAANAALE